MLKNKKVIVILILSSLACFLTSIPLLAKEKHLDKNVFLTDLNHVNLTLQTATDKNELKKLIMDKKPKVLYLEEWILSEKGNTNVLKKIYKQAKKNDIKLYLVVGRNQWIGTKGVNSTLYSLDKYENYIDGIVLRTEPNKLNVWKDDMSIKAQILNLMLDAYSAIHINAKKRNKKFIASFPFWFAEFKGPLGTFSQDTCKYVDKIIFLIDKPEKINEIEVRWNDITCPYNINLTKRALQQDEDGIHEIYYKLKNKLVLYSNFQGYIIDSDSTLKED